jgi:hypothetical protein
MYVFRYIGQNQHIEVLNLCMCQGLTENALVPICNNLHKLVDQLLLNVKFNLH